MTDFLPKPFRKNDLLQKVAQIGLMLDRLQGSPTVKNTSAITKSEDNTAGPDIFNHKAAELLVVLERSLRKGETELAETKAQWLKEEAQSIGADEVRRFAFQIVMAARTGDAARALMYLNRLKRLVMKADTAPSDTI